MDDEDEIHIPVKSYKVVLYEKYYKDQARTLTDEELNALLGFKKEIESNNRTMKVSEYKELDELPF